MTTTENNMKYAAKELTELFPKQDEAPVYSLGFQRWQKLSRAKQTALMIKFDFNYNDCINYLKEM